MPSVSPGQCISMTRGKLLATRVCWRLFYLFLSAQKNLTEIITTTWRLREGGRYQRYRYSTSTPSLPSYYSNPFGMVKHRMNQNLCFDTQNYGTANFTPLNLSSCKDNDAQRFDFDSDGRLRSILDPTKCVEAGSSGTTYRKLYLYDCHGGDWQRWTRWSDGRIRNVYHGKFIGLSYCRRASGTPLELRWYDGGYCGDSQKWV